METLNRVKNGTTAHTIEAEVKKKETTRKRLGGKAPEFANESRIDFLDNASRVHTLQLVIGK